MKALAQMVADPQNPQSKLIIDLCNAIASFVEANDAVTHALDIPRREPSTNDNEQRADSSSRAEVVVGLRELLADYGLKQPQVAKLRKHWNFPSPIGGGRPLRFRKTEVDEWARAQPNQDNLAIVLRCRKHFFR